MDATHIADQVLTASVALAGLLLVFLSNTIAEFERYSTTQQATVLPKFQRRGWFAFGGFCISLCAAGSVLIYYWYPATWLIDAGTSLLTIALLSVFGAAWGVVRGIR